VSMYRITPDCTRLGPLRRDERQLLAYIRERPEVLGLGALVLEEARTRSAPGRLELVLRDPDSNRQYDVALQAGATDESASSAHDRTLGRRAPMDAVASPLRGISRGGC
jgi:hypothetical protein